jgi:hypothetical protein
MAIITIPTSVAGVSIPGNITDTLIKGPLAALFSNAFGYNSHHYPRDLMSSTKQHAIKFTINENIPSSINLDATTDLKTSIEGAATSAVNGIGSFLTNPVDTIVDTAKSTFKTAGALTDSVSSTYTPKKKKTAATVYLYMPDNVNIQYNASYNDTSKLDIALSAAGHAGSALGKLGLGSVGNIFTAGADSITTLRSSPAYQAGLQSLGYAINPNMQVLFDGIDFRQYQLAFTFTPYSRQESDEINKIISLFKQHAMPRALNGGFGMFYIPPSTFNLEFLFNGTVNEKIHKVTESVITNIDVNYSPNGWSAHSDGAPVQTQLTLQFKEIDIVDRNKAEAGY